MAFLWVETVIIHILKRMKLRPERLSLLPMGWAASKGCSQQDADVVCP